MPEQSIPKEAAYQIINDELMLDGNPRLNLASFVTTWMEPECDKLIQASVNKNYVDMDEYPVTTELQARRLPLFRSVDRPSAPHRLSRLMIPGWLGAKSQIHRPLLLSPCAASAWAGGGDGETLFLIGPRGWKQSPGF